MDGIDESLLAALQDNARHTYRELGAVAGVSASTALERVRAMERRGLIRGYRAEVDLAAAGRPVQALVAVRVRPPHRPVIEEFRDWAVRLPEVVGVFVLTGGDDFLLHVAVADTDGLYGLVIDRLTRRREVADVRTSIVFEHVPTGPRTPG